jgi:hypothetical protein
LPLLASSSERARRVFEIMRRTHVPLLVALLLPACVDDAPPPPTVQPDVEASAPFAVEIIDVADDGIAVELANGRDVAADVAVAVNVISRAGVAQTPARRVERLAPFERVALTVPRADVPEFAGDAQISITADARFDDGDQLGPTSAAFAVVAEGARWRAGDPEQTIASVGSGGGEDDDLDEKTGASALAAAQWLCVRVLTTYADAGRGEDYWTDKNPTFRPIRGADIKVFHDGTSFTSRLGDGLDGSKAACLDVSGHGIAANELLTLELYTTGEVNGHALRVETESTGNRAMASTTIFYDGTDDPIDLTPGVSSYNRFNIYMAATYAMFRHGGTGNASLTIKADASIGTQIHKSSNIIFVNPANTQQKFSVAHEVGHFVSRDSGAFFGVTVDPCDDYRTNDGTACDSASHALKSKEHARCAALEGFADFYAADVFNDHAETECWASVGGSATIDCQDGNADFPKRYMERFCASPIPGTSLAGFGVEIDWMRVFWGVHTRGSDDPSMNDMLRWMASGDDDKAWTQTNVYNLLHAAALRAGGSLLQNWNVLKSEHGVDHPVPEWAE